MLTRLESEQEKARKRRLKDFQQKRKRGQLKWRQSLDRMDELDNHSTIHCRLNLEKKRDFTGGGSNHDGPQPAFYAKYMTL